MPYGWTGRCLLVDLSTGKLTTLDTTEYSEGYLGGRGMAARFAWEQMPDCTGPFDPENRIIIATGPFTGTLAPTSGRTVMSGLSPRTYPFPWYTHSTLGGWFGAELKYAGYDSLIIFGRADKPVYLYMTDEGTQMINADNLWGLGCRETQLRLRERYGSRSQILTIGPAGENLVRFATVAHAEENAAAHSGFGAVWGNKNLKAVVVRGSGGVCVAHPKHLIREILAGGSTYRIAATTNIGRPSSKNENKAANPVCSQACTFDCKLGHYATNRHGRRVPAFCIGGCWTHHWDLDGTEYSGGGITIPKGVSFETFQDVDLHETCNDLGLDLWFRLTMQPWFIRCRELGVNSIRGYEVKPDDPAWFESFMHQLAHRKFLGEIFAEDLRRAVDELEGELPDELIRLGRELEFNFGFPAHREGRFWDSEPFPFWAISAMMHASESRDPTIGAHLSSMGLADLLNLDREMALPKFRRLSQKVWGYPEGLEPSLEKKAPVAVWSQHQHMLIDSFPLCDFAFPMLVRPFETREEWESAVDISGDLDIDRRFLWAVTGKDWSRERLDRIAERAFTLERMLLARSGRSRNLEEAHLISHFQLPCRDDGTSVNEAEFSQLLDDYFTARDWDLKYGWPSEKKLIELGLADVVPALQEYRSRLKNSENMANPRCREISRGS